MTGSPAETMYHAPALEDCPRARRCAFVPRWFVTIALIASCALLLGASPRAALAGVGGKDVYVGADGALSRLDLASGTSTRLLNGAGRTIHNPVWSPDGSQVAYLAAPTIQQPGRLDDIYLMSADGTGQRRVSAQGQALHDLSWFPDGHHLLFGTGFNGGFRTHVLHLDDGGITDFPSTTDPSAIYGDQLSPRVSPDGASVAAFLTQQFADGTNQQAISVSDADGQNIRILVDFGAEGSHFLSTPSWSPEGAVAYGSEGVLAEAPLDGSTPTLILDTGTEVSSPIAYSPDQSRLAAPAVRGYDRTSTVTLPIWGLLLADRDGSNMQVLDVGGRQLQPQTSVEWAGANVVLFAAGDPRTRAQSTLFAVQRDGTNLTSLVGLGEFADFDWHS